MKKINKKQSITIAVVVVSILLFVGGIWFVSNNDNETTPAIEKTKDDATDKEVIMKEVLDSTNEYVVVNVDLLKELIGLELEPKSGDENEFVLTDGTHTLVFTVGSSTYTIDGEEKEMKAPAVRDGEVYGIEVETVVKDLGHDITISRTEGKVTDILVTEKETEEVVDTEEAKEPEEFEKPEEEKEPEVVVEKTTMYAKSSVNVRKGSGTSHDVLGQLTKGQQVTKIGEENGWSKIEYNGSTGYVKSDYLSKEKVEVSSSSNTSSSGNSSSTGDSNNSNQNSSSNSGNANNSGNSGNSSTGDNSNTGNTGSTTSGMYSVGDEISKERFKQCANVLRTGVGALYSRFDESAVYYWNSITVCNGGAYGEWMWICISQWTLDSYDYLQDGVKDGLIDQAEAEAVEAAYEELPSLTKRCIEAIAPEGGTELYNYVEALIEQHGGNPDDVPNLGIISESIPGLSVEIVQTRGGFFVKFLAE